MARTRQALRCRARRTNGQACAAYAINGGRVCSAHGGRAPQVKAAAQRRLLEDYVMRALNAEHARWRAAMVRWQRERIATTAALLGVEPADVTPADIGVCRSLYGRPPGPETAPRPRPDRRYGPRQATA